MPETLLSPSQIKLFGRHFEGLALKQIRADDYAPNQSKLPDPMPPEPPRPPPEDLDQLGERPGTPKANIEGGGGPDISALQEAIAREKTPWPDPRYDALTNQLLRPYATLARIYGFSYEGEVVRLPVPTVFLVHGEGREVPKEFSGKSDASGVAIRDWAFEDQILYWEYDRAQYSLRLDIDSGTLEDLLLQPGFENDPGSSRGTRMVSRGTRMASRGTRMAARSDLTARHQLD